METKPTFAELEDKISAVSEKVRKQLSLENHYRILVDSTNDSLYLVDIDGRYLFMNPNHASRMNIPMPDAAGYSYKDFHTPEQTAEFQSKIRTVFETGMSLHDEHESSRGRGYFLRTFSPVRDPANPGSIIAVSVISKDISKRRKIEEALLQSEEKYRQLIEYSTEAIFIIREGKIIFANSRTEAMLGYPMEDLELISFINFVLSEDREMVFDRQKAIFHGDTSAGNYSFRIVNKNGGTIWVSLNSAAIIWDDEPATLNFMRDITNQKKNEARLLQAQKLESIGTLAGGIAHDFNNLLMGIQGHTSLALLKLSKDDPNYDHIKTIESLVASGANLTKQLLGFARGGKYVVKKADLNALIDKASRTLEHTKREIRIHRHFEPNLWPADIDQGQIEQVLMNIFINAAQSMPGGGELYLETKNACLDESHFKTFAGKGGNYVKISVTDTGSGMDEKTKERIFEPFFTTKEMGRGTGLGLASAYGIIKNHNGFINVYSEKGQGSTFNIYLPAAVKAEETGAAAIEAARGLSRCSETILLVDDEAVVQEVAGAMLKALGCTVIAASDGTSALEIYKQHQSRIDLVILDMVMPEMSGGEVFDEIRKISPQSKVLLSSGYSLNGQASRIIARGCNGFIQKPFTLDDLYRQIRRIMGDAPTPPGLTQPSLPF
jgi:PAS domain S-box-containing protein